MTATTNTKTKASGKKKSAHSPLTKEERRIKYTQIARDRTQRLMEREKYGKMICYNCRQRGHVVANCPQQPKFNEKDRVSSSSTTTSTPPPDLQQQLQQQKKPRSSSPDGGVTVTGRSRICYKCGSTDHTLHHCPLLQQQKKKKRLLHSTTSEPDSDKHDDEQDKHRASMKAHETDDDQHELDYLPFATCFICTCIGHLASQCPQNPNGIYIYGGQNAVCHLCGSKKHRAKFCPARGNDDKRSKANDCEESQGKDCNQNDDYYNDLLEQDGNDINNAELNKKRQPRVVKF